MYRCNWLSQQGGINTQSAYPYTSGTNGGVVIRKIVNSNKMIDRITVYFKLIPVGYMPVQS